MSDIEDLARRVQGGMGEPPMQRLPKRTPSQGGGGGTAKDPRDHREANEHARDLSRRGLFQVTDEEREAADRQRAMVAAMAKASDETTKEMNRLNDILGNTIRGLGGMAIAVQDYVRIADLLNGGNGMRRVGGQGRNRFAAGGVIGHGKNDPPKKERKADEHN